MVHPVTFSPRPTSDPFIFSGAGSSVPQLCVYKSVWDVWLLSLVHSWNYPPPWFQEGVRAWKLGYVKEFVFAST